MEDTATQAHSEYEKLRTPYGAAAASAESRRTTEPEGGVSHDEGSRAASSTAGSLKSAFHESSVRGGLFSGLQERISSSLLTVCGNPVVSSRIDSIFLPALEVLSFVILAVYLTGGWGNSDTESALSYFRIAVAPMRVITTVTGFSIVFLIAFLYIVLGAALVIYLLIFDGASSESAMAKILVIYLRLTRTIFLIPIAGSLSEAWRADIFGGTMELYQVPGVRLIDFPVFLYLVFGVVGFIGLGILVVMDGLFLLDKFRIRRDIRELVTTSPDGRFPLLVIIVELSVAVGNSFVPPKFSMIFWSVAFVLTLVMLVFAIRTTPYISTWFTIVITVLLSLCLTAGFVSVWMSSTKELWTLSILAVGPVFVSLAVVFTLLRFYLLFRHFKSGAFASSTTGVGTVLFVRSGAFDLAIMLAITVKPENRHSAIVRVLRETSITKSTELCHMLIALVIDEPLISASILGHAKAIRRKTWLHHEMALSFYLDKISQQRAAHSFGKGDVRVARTLSALRRREEKLRELYQFVLGRIVGELGSGSSDSGGFAKFEQALSEIAQHRSFCESTYSRLMETHTTAQVLRAYGRFAAMFLNDMELAKRCRKEAENIRRIRPLKLAKSEDPQSLSTIDSIGSPRSEALSIPDSSSISQLGSRGSSSAANELDGDGTQEGTQIGTVMTGGTSIGKSSSTKNVRTKIRALRVGPAIFLRIVLCAFLFALVSLFVASFVVFTLMQSRFNTSATNINIASRARQLTTSGPHFLRRLQIGCYNSSVTMLETERNPTEFRRRGIAACTELKEDVASVYLDTPTIAEWWRTPVTAYEKRSDNKTSRNHMDFTYTRRNYSLYDAVLAVGDKCLKAFQKSNVEFGGREQGHFIEDDDDFVFVTINEPIVQKGMGGLIDHFIESEEEYGHTQRLILVGLSVSPLLFVPLFLIGCCWYTIIYRRSFRGLKLVRKDHLTTLYVRFGGRIDELGTSRIQFGRLSTIQMFSLSAIIMAVLAGFILSAFAIMGWLATEEFDVRNREYSALCDLKTDCHSAHMWAVEVLYRDDTLYDDDQVVQGLISEVTEMQVKLKNLRFGNEHLPGNDKVDYAHKLYYNAPCSEASVTNASSSLHDYLKCQTLTRLAALFREAGMAIASGDFHNPILRASREYETIIELDNNEDDRGVLQDGLTSLREGLNEGFDDSMNFYSNFILLLLLVAMPVVVFMSVILLWRAAAKLSLDARQVREVMALLPSSVLMDPVIYDYLCGKSGWSTQMKKRRQTDQKGMIDVLKKCAYAMLWFDRSRRILSANEQAEDVLNLRSSGTVRLDGIFTPDSLATVTEWMKTPFKETYTPFQSEVDAIYGDQQFTVQLNIVRDEEVFIALVENIQGAKKKKILEETEKRTKEMDEILCNILPTEIAKRMTLGDTDIVATHKSVSPWFADICDFTGWSKLQDPGYIVRMLHLFFSAFDEITKRNELEKIKTIGDCYFAVCGVPTYKPMHAKIAMDNAIEIWHMIKRFNREHETSFVLRQGISSGKVVSGVIGTWKWCYDVWGSTINMAARMEQNCPPDKIMIARSTYEVIYDQYDFVERKVALQGLGQVRGYMHSPSTEDVVDEGEVAVAEEEGEVASESQVVVDSRADDHEDGGMDDQAISSDEIPEDGVVNAVEVATVEAVDQKEVAAAVEVAKVEAVDQKVAAAVEEVEEVDVTEEDIDVDVSESTESGVLEDPICVEEEGEVEPKGKTQSQPTTLGLQDDGSCDDSAEAPGSI